MSWNLNFLVHGGRVVLAHSFGHGQNLDLERPGAKSDFDLVAELIASDEYDIDGFELLEIPHPKVFCFGNHNKNQFFDVVKFWDDKWQFSFIKISENGLQNALAHSIQEAVEKYEF